MKKNKSKELANIPVPTVCHLTNGRTITQTILIVEGSTVEQIQQIANRVGRELCGDLLSRVEVEGC